MIDVLGERASEYRIGCKMQAARATLPMHWKRLCSTVLYCALYAVFTAV